jgi:diguanylate cyclase (GGDEF)-like protein/PAS domain S-box-containing protein
VNQKRAGMKTGTAQLRALAELKLASAPQMDAPGRRAGELLYELQVHEIELEMQNEELRRAQLALEESRDRYMDLYEFAPVGYFTLTGKALISEVNLTGAALLGEERKRVLQSRFARFVTPADRDRYHRLIGSVLQRDERQTCDLALQRGDGVVFQAQLDCLRMAAGDEPPIVRLALTDITERKRGEAELRVAAAAFESQEGMLVTDASTTIMRVNRAFTDITGFTAADVVGQTPRLFKSGRHDAAFYAGMWRDLARTGEWRGEIWNLHKSGTVYPEWLTITAVKGDHGDVTHYIGTLIDITQRKSAEAVIEQLAFYDPMTRLANRRLLLDRLQQALAARARSPRRGAILFIDLDNFKSLNDTLGHDVGDLLLQQVALRLLTCVRAGDTVARLGGDEFVVMLGDLSANPQEAASHAELVGEKILLALAPPFMLAGHEHQTTGCIGVTLFSDHREIVEDLLKRADLAMYRAKAVGRNTLRFFDPEMQAAVTARAALETDLRRGVREGQFILHYQPQVDREGRITGAEALVRWQHPRRGLVSPAEFIPLAEEIGLIQPLGQWVLETACAQLVAWSARPDTAHLKLAMNVSAREFRHPEFVSRVFEVIDRIGADPRKLMLEFTESVLVDDMEETIAKMNALRARGGGVALDDFGTGYSSLSYLKHLPLDQLKIDQSFVRDVFINSNDAAIAFTILALGQSLGLAVIAEGVETEDQRNLLARQGCHAFQGFHFGRPGPVGALRVTAEPSAN